MTPSEFLDLAFSLLGQLNSIATEQYFERDPQGITFIKVALLIKSPGVVGLDQEIAWDDGRTATYSATGATDWQNKIAHILLENPA